ncbi:vancomycin high temperature exclusion protein [Nocardiopsis flavescens]|uniref:SanA/YdcF family protein n=1 Tax=Nocardiopsis flavescens TaxID=758803 RepID=UPI00366715B9
MRAVRNPGAPPLVSPDVTTSEEASAESPDGTAPERPRRRRRGPLLLLLLALALVAAFAPFAWVVAGTAEHRHATAADAPERPVALVLGAGVRDDGLPTRLLARRLELAADLYFTDRVEVVLVSGDNSVEHYNETDTMRDHLVAAGVPAERIVGDYAGFSTWESCVRAREVFGVSGATVVTQDFHLPRAVSLCRAAGIDAVGVADAAGEERAFSTRYGWVREVPAAVAALGTALTRPDPTFLGRYETAVDDALAAAREDGD